MTTFRPIDHARAARVVLAVIDNDLKRANQVLAEANAEDAVHLLIAVLITSLLGTMAATGMSDDGIRQVFERTILGAGVAEGDTNPEPDPT